MLTCTGTAAFTSTKTVNGPGNYTSDSFTPNGSLALTVGPPITAAMPATSPASSPCNAPNESSVVSPAAPDIETTATSPVTIGEPISDKATLSGATTNAGGTITFKLYGPNDADCSGTVAYTNTVNVSGNGEYDSGEFTPTAVGTYRWTADYSGDDNNDPASSPCNAPNESSVVNAAPATIDTAQELFPQDSATISATAGGTPTGTVRLRPLRTERHQLQRNPRLYGGERRASLTARRTRTTPVSRSTRPAVATTSGSSSTAATRSTIAPRARAGRRISRRRSTTARPTSAALTPALRRHSEQAEAPRIKGSGGLCRWRGADWAKHHRGWIGPSRPAAGTKQLSKILQMGYARDLARPHNGIVNTGRGKRKETRDALQRVTSRRIRQVQGPDAPHKAHLAALALRRCRSDRRGCAGDRGAPTSWERRHDLAWQTEVELPEKDPDHEG